MKKLFAMFHRFAASGTAGPARAAAVGAAVLLAGAAASVEADQVEMQNGDRYLGQVLSLNADTLVLQSELLGKITLPRARIATISLGAPAPANVPPPPSPAKTPPLAPLGSTNHPPLAAAMRNLGANTNLVEQIRGQFLTDAGDAANNKFDELVAGLVSGKLDMEGLRAQAKSSAAQLRTLKRDAGGAADVSLDLYLDILDKFLKETAPPAPLATNGAAKAN